MKHFKIFISFVLLVLVITGCNFKVNLNSNLNQSQIKVEPNANAQPENLNQTSNENLNQNINAVSANSEEYQVIVSPENMVTEVKIGEVVLKDFKEICGNDVMVYAEPHNGHLIFKAFNPGSDKPVSSLYLLNVQTKACKKLTVSSQLSDFGARILSPDQTKLALALETNEAKELKLLDLINDTAKVLVTLPVGETLNAGYGALSNHFDIKWLDNLRIQYTVYEDTVKNYAVNAPEKIEKVKQVKIVNIE